MKPLVFCDVDGVLNDLEMLHALNGAEPPVEYMLFPTFSNGNQYAIYMPKYIPALMRQLVEVAEVQWLTTHRCEANNAIRAVLKIPELPCIDDGDNARNVRWKWDTAKPVAEEALRQGRRVYWVEDFGNDIQAKYAFEAGVICLDTSLSHYVLQEDNFIELIERCKQDALDT